MNTITIHIKTDTKTRDEAKKVAEEFGFSLTALVNSMLKQIVRTKRLYLSVNEEPSEYFKQLMKEADEDIEAGKVISFKNSKEALDYLDREIMHEKKARSSH